MLRWLARVNLRTEASNLGNVRLGGLLETQNAPVDFFEKRIYERAARGNYPSFNR